MEGTVGKIEPIILFSEHERVCLTQIKATPRKVRSTRLGTVDFTVESGADGSGNRMIPHEFHQFVPKGKSFAFDAIWEVTRLHYLEFKQREEIQQEVPFHISTGSISNLYREGVAYFRACHEAAMPELRKRYRRKERLFILQMDGTNEGGAWTHFQVRDSISNNILLARRIPTENQDDIEAMLRDIDTWFGRPDAVISDMSRQGIAAVESLWNGEVPLFVCQFHFLRDIGKDLLGDLHEDLRKSISSARVSRELNDMRKRFADKKGRSVKDFQQGIRIIDWILDYKSELNGEGVPFDLKWLKYFERCRAVCRKIDEILNSPQRRGRNDASKVLEKIRYKLGRLVDNKVTARRYNALKRSAKAFDQIRMLFYTDISGKAAPLSRDVAANESRQLTKPDDLHCQLDTLAEALREDATRLDKANAARYTKAAEQLERHKSRLSNHVIINGQLHPIPRTNNLCELSFRETKRQIRRTNGKKNLVRVLDQTPAETMLLQNLQDEEYRKIVFGDAQVYDAFSKIPSETVKGILKEMSTGNSKKVIDPIIKEPDFLAISKNYFLRRVV